VNLAVMRKTARDALLLWVITVLTIVIFECLLVRALGEFADEITEIWFKRAVLRQFVKALVGADLAENVTTTSLMTIGFAHPFLYTLVWGFVLATGTRVIAGEIDRGTADLLLSLPVSRRRIYTSVSLVWVLAGIPICVAPLVGVWIGQWASPLREPVELARLRFAPFNLLAMYLAIGAGTMLVSSVFSRRGPAIATVLAALLASFLLSFLTQFWKLAERFSFLGILHYYRPLESVRSGNWPVMDISVLCGTAAILWLGGLWWFSRRDIPAL
jgi:ABC-2 type transport system permease protein